MRLFVALDIDSAIRQRITVFRDQLRPLAPDVRWGSPENFHVTLQFLGETTKADEIHHVMQSIKSLPVPLDVRSAGFFPNSKAPRVFWIGIQSDEHLQQLVSAISQALAPLGFPREPGLFTPHLTLARSGSGRPQPVPSEKPAPSLQRVRDELAKLPSPDFGTMTAHEFYLYESHLSPSGPRYEKRATFPLRPSATANIETL